MSQFDFHEAGEKLADLNARALAGEEVVISGAGKPVATLMSTKDPRAGPGWASFGAKSESRRTSTIQ